MEMETNKEDGFVLSCWRKRLVYIRVTHNAFDPDSLDTMMDLIIDANDENFRLKQIRLDESYTHRMY